jgi:hypothetical protein
MFQTLLSTVLQVLVEQILLQSDLIQPLEIRGISKDLRNDCPACLRIPRKLDLDNSKAPARFYR